MIKKTLLASAIALAVSAPAHALVQVPNFDWTTPFGTFNDVKSFTVSGLGNASVKQEVNSSGNIFVGAHFSEFGAAYAFSFTDKNDLPDLFGKYIFFNFQGLAGSITNINGDGSFSYKFDPVGFVNVSYGSSNKINLATNWFTLPVLGINGSTADSTGLNVKGTSELLGLVAASTGTTSFKDENDQSLDWFQQHNGLFFDVVTTNTIKSFGGLPTKCDAQGFGRDSLCKNLEVQSTGDVTLFRVPEPGSLALLGAGLLGAGVVRRRKVK